MKKIVLKQTSININDYELNSHPVLEEYFTQYDKLKHCFYMQCFEYNELNKVLTLPRGLDIFWLEREFNAKAVINHSYDKFDMMGDVKIKYGPKDDVQKQTLRFMLGMDEYSNTAGASQLCINLNTGAGKTYVSIASSVIMNIKPIIIASNIEWIKQWKERFIEYTSIKPEEIYIFQGAASITQILKGLKDPSDYKVFLSTHGTIKSYGDNYGWKKITELFKTIGAGIKIFDEAHLNFDNLCKIDFYTNTYKTYYLTATPARSDRQENLLYRLYFKNVYSIDLFDEDNDPRTHYIALHFKSRPTPREISGCNNYTYGLDRNKYIKYLMTKPNYYKMIHVVFDILNKLNAFNKVLIYIGTNEAIYETREWIVKNYPEFANDIGIFTSLVSKEERTLQLDNRIILSTTKSAGAASDIAGLSAVVVLAEPFKSAVLARQTLGRTRDYGTFYIDIVDDSFIYLRNYYKAKQPIFAKYALSCRDINITDELDNKANEIEEFRNRIISPTPKLFEFKRNG